MCAVSMVGDAYTYRWYPYTPAPNTSPDISTYYQWATKADLDALRREVEEMKELLKAAKRIDELSGQPDCENEAKLEVLRKVAELVGVDLSDVLP